MQKISEQLDIFGNWKPIKCIQLENKCNQRYKTKEFTSNKKFVKNGGVLNVNKAFIKSN